MDGDPQDAADGEEEEGDDDDDGDVPPHVVLQFVMSRQLEEGTTEETPGEEAFLGGADPGLELLMKFVLCHSSVSASNLTLAL